MIVLQVIVLLITVVALLPLRLAKVQARTHQLSLLHRSMAWQALILCLYYVGLILQSLILTAWLWMEDKSFIVLICGLVSIAALTYRYVLLYGETIHFGKMMHKSREKYRRVVDNVREIVIRLSFEGHILFLNKAWENLTGHTIHESLGNSFYDYVLPEDRPLVEKALRFLQTKDLSFTANEQFRYLTKQNEIRWAEIFIVSSSDADEKNPSYIGSFYDITLQKQQASQLSKDLVTAKKLQKSVLSHPLYDTCLSIEAFYRPSSGLSGDMYYWVKIDEYCYGIVLIDVMGHGITSALVSMSVRAMLQDLIVIRQSPKLVMQELNRYMTEMFRTDDEAGISPYFTATYVLIDTNKQTVEYVNAGHCTGLWVQENGCQMISSTCMPVGIVAEMPIKKESFTYDSPAFLVLYTDGFLELISPTVEASMESLMQQVRDQFSKDTNYSLIKNLENRFITYANHQDDVTFIVVEITPGQEI